MFDFTTPVVETKPDPFTLEALYLWLRAQPSARTYTYGNPADCLVVQYLKDRGVRVWMVSNDIDMNWTPLAWLQKLSWGKQRRARAKKFVVAAQHRVAIDYPRTLGAAATRCRKAMEARG